MILLLLSTLTWAQDAPTLEFHRGVVLGSARILGMGGACIGLAEGARTQQMNPAAIARRKQGGWMRILDSDADLATINLPWSQGLLDPSNVDEVQPIWLGTANANVRLGRVGVGVGVVSHAYSLDGPVLGEGAVRLRQNEFAMGGAWTSPSASWSWGAMFMLEQSVIQLGGDGQGAVLTARGPGLNLGGLWSPTGKNLRVGAQFMFAQTADRLSERGDSAYALTGVHSPYQLGVGVAKRLGGPSPWNPSPRFGDWTHAPLPFVPSVILASDLLLFGPSEGAVSPGAWLEGREDEAGLSWSVRVGAEATIWDGRLRLRTGSYWEPGRFTEEPGRLHGTAGADVRVRLWVKSRVKMPFDMRLTPAIDVADGYLRTGLGVGVW